jgi:hypothetical protein
MRRYRRDYHREHYDNDPDYRTKMRAVWLRKYGLSLVEFAELLKAQGGRCAICGSTDWGKTGGSVRQWPNVDHDHATGQVRGLLCDRCNRGLGYFGDSAELLGRLRR